MNTVMSGLFEKEAENAQKIYVLLLLLLLHYLLRHIREFLRNYYTHHHN